MSECLDTNHFEDDVGFAVNPPSRHSYNYFDEDYVPGEYEQDDMFASSFHIVVTRNILHVDIVQTSLGGDGIFVLFSYNKPPPQIQHIHTLSPFSAITKT